MSWQPFKCLVALLFAVFGAALGSLVLGHTAIAQETNDVTQRFTDLRPTPPRDDEIVAPPVDLDSSFPPPGPPVEPGPPVIIPPEELEEGEEPEEPEEDLIESNEALTKTAAASAHQSGEGRWLGPDQGIPATGKAGSGDVAIHAALLRSTASPAGAEILFFAGDAHDLEENRAGGENVNHTGVFKIIDPIANKFSVEQLSSAPARSGGRIADLFCSGHAQLQDGRLLVAGGTVEWPPDAPGIHGAAQHFTGIRESFIFDPKTNNWSDPFLMNFEPTFDFTHLSRGGGRWYPSLVTLNSNRVLALWGHPAGDDGRHTNNTPEFFKPKSRMWEFLGRETDIPESGSVFYPRVHLLPNGRVFRATPINTLNVEINPIPQSLTDRNNISVPVSNAPGAGYPTGIHYPSVLLPLTSANRYEARILLAGQQQSEYVILDTRIPKTPESWRRTAARSINKVRLHANATILPTGEIFVSGGKSEQNAGSLDRSKVLEGEIYDPFEDTWRTVAPAIVPREYHSVALLMPDGRVWHGGTSIDGASGIQNQEHRVDLYEPWYYSETRPVIRAVSGPPDPIYSGAPLMHLHDSGLTEVMVDHFRKVREFVLIRAGSVTHAFNFDQRYIELQSELLRKRRRDSPVPGFRFTFRLASPPSSSIAPPGNYLLFAIDDRGVPSVGRFIRIDRRFVGRLRQEAEDFTTERGAVSVRKNGTVVLRTSSGPFGIRGPILEYGGIDFGPKRGVVKQFSARLSSAGARPAAAKLFKVRLDRPNGQQIAILRVPRTKGFVKRTASLTTRVNGVHNVFIKYRTRTSKLPVFVDWFKFK